MSDIQKQISTRVQWNFNNPKYETIEKFYQSISDYNKDILKIKVDNELNSTLISISEVAIQYLYFDDNDEDIEPDFLLKADNGNSFSLIELLFKVHNTVCNNLKEQDKVFFEGFLLWEGENLNYPNIPLYFLLLGS
jgi:hypothetical protein